MTAPTTALDRVQRFLAVVEPVAAEYHSNPVFGLGLGMGGDVPTFTLADLAEVTRMASEGIR